MARNFSYTPWGLKLVHMRNLITYLYCVALALAAIGPVRAGSDGKGRKLDEQIADKTAIIAANRLVANADDERAFMMLQMALRVDPANRTANRVMDMIAQEKKLPRLKTRVTEKKLYEVMGKRANQLYEDKQHLNLACLYFRMIEQADPDSPVALIGLQKLARRDSIKPKLTELLGNIDLYDKTDKLDFDLPDKPKVAEKTEAKPVPTGPMLSPSLPAGWSVCCFKNGRWVNYPLNKMANQTSGGILTVRNTTGIGRKAMLVYNAVREGNFVVEVIVKGGKEVVMQPNDGSDRQFSVPIRGDKHWYRYRIARGGGRVRCWLNGKHEYIKNIKELADSPLVLGVVMWKDQVVQVRL